MSWFLYEDNIMQSWSHRHQRATLFIDDSVLIVI